MNPHILNCEQEQCLVCHSKLAELQAALKPLYIHIRYNLRYQPETAQERLTSYD